MNEDAKLNDFLKERLEADVSAKSPMTAHRNFHTEVGSAGCIIEKVVTK